MTFKTRHLLAGATAISILATTSALWAQSAAVPATGAMPVPAVSAPAPTPVPSASAAAEKPLSPKEMLLAFAKADANKDGKLTKQEAIGVPGLVPSFEMVDGDGDKMVSKAEFEKALVK